jgi:hypothetical protein
MWPFRPSSFSWRRRLCSSVPRAFSLRGS